MNDKTLYEFNGKELGKGPLVLAVIKYLAGTEGKTFESIKASLEPKGFNDNVIIKNSDYEEKLNTNPDFKNRFFNTKPVKDSDGLIFLVWNQWGLGNIDEFVLWARDNDLNIKIHVDKESTLFNYFEYYKNNSAQEWIDDYRSRCEYLKSINVDEFDFSGEQFLENYWRLPENGISSIKQGPLSYEEFAALKVELSVKSKEIHVSPSSGIYSKTKDWATEAQTEGKFKTIKTSVINRYFCACDPLQYCTILKYKNLKNFVKRWKEEELGPKIDPRGNWAELNSRIVQSIKMRGFEEEDTYLLNTFIYLLKEHLLGEVEHAFGEKFGTNDMKNKSQCNETASQSLNTILYGPPGTGKTFNTINRAVNAVDPDFVGTRTKIKERYDELVKDQRIHFVTFHQSFSYEEFIEGLRATTDAGQISYSVEPGIFKRICGDAVIGAKASNSFDKALQEFKNRIDAEPELQLTTVQGKPYSVEYHGNSTFRVFPSGSKNDDLGRGYPVSIDNIRKLYQNPEEKGLYNPSYVKSILEFFKNELKLEEYKYSSSDDKDNYVLIIDEINRGNISSIFGDLITLIEPSKRAGQEEALSVELPYSKEPFSVPSNLHIIGTMNTADRSLALMDTALRRRFDFVEMMPNLKVLENLEVEGIDIRRMLEVMNQRIEVLYDREHTLGHAFFIPLKKAAESERFDMLQGILKNKILPLLEEYFFEDWEKIRLVLGDNQKQEQGLAFISMVKNNSIDDLFGSDEEAENLGLDEIITYQRNDGALGKTEAYQGIYGK